MKTFENVLVEKKENSAIVTINRPTKLNALNKQTIQDLHDALKELKDDKDVRVVILTGSGEKAFVAGADISEFADFSKEEGAKMAKEGQEKLFDYVQNFSKPIIAAVNGFALGGGLELAMASHIRVASTNAKMGLPEVTLGVIPGYGGTQRLSQLVGKGKAMEMIMTAQMIKAEEALDNRLVNHVVAQEELMDFCTNLAQQICKNSSQAIAQAIEAINAGFEDGVNGYQKEIENFGNCFQSEDFIEGTTAFLEKRKPKF